MSRGYYAISIDGESNGLAGQMFALAMVACDATGERSAATYRCPIIGPVDPWVAENVLPVIEHIPVNCADYADLIARFRATYASWGGEDRRDSVVTHVSWPVEARLLLDAFPGEEIWKGPYPLNDTAVLLQRAGYKRVPVEQYLEDHQIPLPDGAPHDPLYDCRVAERAWFHLMTGGVRS
ncbi:hypothetical protein E1091_01325 [Micromonospora fluostatini]|uniref:Uncharacterized protein n=1 Tax=Micromonospora fluostatini TaxID=1629071 RepID=A0ABY2DRL2_9ACTN|nr:hypothetical protein E1091_01325 [Micromonospora fluostatini]